jgi:hypothetical protein
MTKIYHEIRGRYKPNIINQLININFCAFLCFSPQASLWEW